MGTAVIKAVGSLGGGGAEFGTEKACSRSLFYKQKLGLGARSSATNPSTGTKM